MKQQEVKLCRDCKHSMPEPNSTWVMRCMRPKVNARDPFALAGANLHGSSARDERSKTWIAFPACGMAGKLWEANE